MYYYGLYVYMPLFKQIYIRRMRDEKSDLLLKLVIP